MLSTQLCWTEICKEQTMTKISITGILLFVVMVVTAITVSRNQPAYAHDQHVWMSPPLAVGSTTIFDDSKPKVIVYGESGGLEDNPFIIVVGLVAILSLAFGFLRYHRILEDRRSENENAQIAQRKSNQFGTRSAGKEPTK
jgi:hypothetical protein